MNIIVGKYYHCKSPIHRLDPRTKLLALALFIVSVFLVRNPWGFLIIASFILLITLLARLPLLAVLRSLRPMIWIFVSIMILHVFFANGDSKPLFSVGPIKAKWEGIYSGIIVSCRFMLIAVSAAILTLTTVPLRLADGISATLSPLRKVKLPVAQFPTMMLITLHFIPVLFSEAEKLIWAQKMRGAQLEGRNPLKRLKYIMPIFAPMLRSAFRQADELALGMESRCYHGGARSHLYELALGKSDGIALIVTAAVIPATLAVNGIFS